MMVRVRRQYRATDDSERFTARAPEALVAGGHLCSYRDRFIFMQNARR